MAAAILITACGDSRWVAEDGSKQPDGRARDGSSPFAMRLDRLCGASHGPMVLEIAWPPGTVAAIGETAVVRTYVSPWDHTEPRLLGEPDANAVPPSDVAFTGYRHGRRELWVAPSDDDTYVYVKHGATFERWARAAASIIRCE